MSYWLLWFFDSLYGATVMSYGFAPGVVGFLACLRVPSYARWPVPLLMLLTTLGAVRYSAHEFGLYLAGCALFLLLSLLGLYLRARRSKTGLLRQHPYDLLAFAAGTAILSFFYHTPMM